MKPLQSQSLDSCYEIRLKNHHDESINAVEFVVTYDLAHPLVTIAVVLLLEKRERRETKNKNDLFLRDYAFLTPPLRGIHLSSLSLNG